jgi:hypothetical protein
MLWPLFQPLDLSLHLGLRQQVVSQVQGSSFTRGSNGGNFCKVRGTKGDSRSRASGEENASTAPASLPDNPPIIPIPQRLVSES